LSEAITGADRARVAFHWPFAGLSGLLFGLGLGLSGMSNPARVLGFLDVVGTWDPTLAFVMCGALAVTIPGFFLQRKTARPWFSARFNVPERSDLDRPLVAGAVLFGIGWGLAGFCPGPAIVATATGLPAVFAFVAAMIAGSWLGTRLPLR